MSANRENGKRATNYRQPPVEHRFKKGQSGNPNGRPKKKGPAPGLNGSAGPVFDRLHAIALEEAHRPIAVKEGDRVSEIPAAQAVMRNMFRLAAQGDHKIGRQLLDILARAEAARAAFALEILQGAVEYQEKWSPLFDKHESEGRDLPEIYPNPDDLIINPETGEVTIDGPMSADQAGSQKLVFEYGLKTLARFQELGAALSRDPKNTALRNEYKELKKFNDFLMKAAERRTRHQALREARKAMRENPKKSST